LDHRFCLTPRTAVPPARWVDLDLEFAAEAPRPGGWEAVARVLVVLTGVARPLVVALPLLGVPGAITSKINIEHETCPGHAYFTISGLWCPVIDGFQGWALGLSFSIQVPLRTGTAKRRLPDDTLGQPEAPSFLRSGQ
jgi:hypothetical protein